MPLHSLTEDERSAIQRMMPKALARPTWPGLWGVRIAHQNAMFDEPLLFYFGLKESNWSLPQVRWQREKWFAMDRFPIAL